jgi:hypothetical protein
VREKYESIKTRVDRNEQKIKELTAQAAEVGAKYKEYVRLTTSIRSQGDETEREHNSNWRLRHRPRPPGKCGEDRSWDWATHGFSFVRVERTANPELSPDEISSGSSAVGRTFAGSSIATAITPLFSPKRHGRSLAID